MKINSVSGQEDRPPPGFHPLPEILLHPQIPKPMHGIAPRTILGQAWWDAERHAACNKYKQHCWACGVYKLNAKLNHWLEAHEMYDINYAKGTMTYTHSVGLCPYCHKYIHAGRLLEEYKAGKISMLLLMDITNHGETILHNAGIGRPPGPSVVSDWESWRLILNGQAYPGLWPSYETWAANYRIS